MQMIMRYFIFCISMNLLTLFKYAKFGWKPSYMFKWMSVHLLTF